jgi:periplasmic protein TonB
MNRYRYAFLLIVLFQFLTHQATAQSWGDSSLKNRPLFFSVETAPKFPGGLHGYYQFIADSLQMPANRFSKSSHRVVMVNVIINKQGTVVFAEISKGVNEAYNMAALDLMRKMPAWEPGRQNGYPVPVSLEIPVLFVD